VGTATWEKGIRGGRRIARTRPKKGEKRVISLGEKKPDPAAIVIGNGRKRREKRGSGPIGPNSFFRGKKKKKGERGGRRHQ